MHRTHIRTQQLIGRKGIHNSRENRRRKTSCFEEIVEEKRVVVRVGLRGLNMNTNASLAT
jgi:hypothetical protein